MLLSPPPIVLLGSLDVNLGCDPSAMQALPTSAAVMSMFGTAIDDDVSGTLSVEFMSFTCIILLDATCNIC